MEQIRIVKNTNVLDEKITVYIEDNDEARHYLKLLRKTWPKTITEHRSILKIRG